MGTVRKPFFKIVKMKKTLICSGKYENFNKITKEKIKYIKKKKFFFVNKKTSYLKNPSPSFKGYFLIDLKIINIKKLSFFYNVTLQNTEGYDFHLIKLNKNNFKIKESIDLSRINTTFSGECIIQK